MVTIHHTKRFPRNGEGRRPLTNKTYPLTELERDLPLNLLMGAKKLKRDKHRFDRGNGNW